MSLYQDWQNLIDNQTEETFEAFWKEYAETESKVYAHILENHTEHLHGTVEELVAQFECNKVIFTGFLDGINSKRYFEKRIEISASCQFLKFLTVSDRIRDNQMKTCIQRTNELADLLTDQVNI